MMKLIGKHKWFIFIIALLIRLTYVIFFPQLEGEELCDTWEYDKLAMSLASGEGFSQDVRWPPLFPLFLAGIYALFGHDFFFVRIIQGAMGSFACVLVYLIGKETFDEKIGFLSGLLAVFYPGFITYTGLALTETLTTFLVATSVYFLVKAVAHKNQWRWYVFAGIILGLTSLCRPEMILFPFFLLLVLLLIYKNKKQALVGFLILLSLTAITIAPRTVRNYILFHKFIPVNVGFGRALWLGSYPEEWTEYHMDREPIKTLFKENDHIEFNAKLTKMGVENIKSHPFLYLKFSIKKFFRFWVTSHSNTVKGLGESFVSTIQNKKYKILLQKSIFFVINMGIILLGFLGIFVARRRWKIVLLLSAIIIYKVLLHMALFSCPRFQVHIMPVMLIFSAVGIQYLWYLGRHRDDERFSIVWGNPR